MKFRSAALLALRIGLTALLLVLAVLMIDFSDKTVFLLNSGEKIESVSHRHSGSQIHVTLSDGSIRVLADHDLKSFESRLGVVAIVKGVRPWPAILVVPLLLILFSVQALRWRLLLAANGFDLSMGRAFRVVWAGTFFNQILPGSVGGDVAKAMIVAKGEERKAAVFGTVLLDRLVGLMTVVVIAGLAVLPVIGRPELRPVVWLIVALIVGGFAGAAIYFNPAFRKWGFARRLKERLPFRRAIEEVDDVLKTMHHAPRTILAGAGLSAAGQAATIVAIFCLAQSLGATSVPLSDFFLLEPIIFLVTAVPVSVGGWGVEQVAYAKLFGMAGMAATAAVALSVLYKLSVLVVALPGGVLFAAGATRREAGGPVETPAPADAGPER
ncbi:MAG TPA: lysylphosphatidylglycerol synthase transmembrane domain-containing protein [Planctomycetota bacterium]|nr:lysylphosphatidylglycerol synthase transmembrane domain-containing protein [Planctomycetota bacterium]